MREIACQKVATIVWKRLEEQLLSRVGKKKRKAAARASVNGKRATISSANPIHGRGE
jgi:hypothetical protein